MSQSNSKAVTQVEEIVQKLQQDASQFSEYEADFIHDQNARIEKYGENTYFSDKQVALIERIHAERVRGEAVKKPKRKNSGSVNISNTEG